MNSTQKQSPVSALHEILKWSSARPDWQRDALRRIVAQGTLSHEDLKELDLLCRSKYDLIPQGVACPTPIIFGIEHLPPSPEASSSVSLVSIGNLQNVNRIPSSRSITFGGKPGLTVIYGENGAGKSGFARVIKRACRSRGSAQPILPNAFSATKANAPASAEITYSVGGTQTVTTWIDGISGVSHLGNIFVFDVFTANHYFQEDDQAVFTPLGLDVLEKLVHACDQLGRKLREEIEAMDAKIRNWRLAWSPPQTSSAWKLVEGLSSKTKKSEIESLAIFSAEQVARLDELNQLLRSDSLKKSRATRASAVRLRGLADMIEKRRKELSAENCEIAKLLLEDASIKDQAAKQFADHRFELSFLSGTGSELWRVLWEAARDFSNTEAYMNDAFPSVVEDVKCVLCQQELSPSAAQRLKEFEAFCKDQSQSLATTALEKVKRLNLHFEQLSSLAAQFEIAEADLAAELSETEQIAVKKEVEVLESRLILLRENMRTHSWKPPESLLGTAVATMVARTQYLEKRAVEEESAHDPVVREALARERDELTGIKWLKEHKEELLRCVDDHILYSKLKKCADKEVKTSSITTTNRELTQKVVTEAFRDRFEQEIKDLGLKTIDIQLEQIQGKKGSVQFGLRLQGYAETKPQRIASEGEHRCISLAMFLAELSQSSHQSSLVFDDPVSSLDHRHRESIARRLVREASIRQVIVFTHDAIFLDRLVARSKETGIEAVLRQLQWDQNHPGMCVDGLPWEVLPPSDRIDKLEKFQREIKKSWNNIPSNEDRSRIRIGYSKLRATLERIVEKTVFSDVVERFRSYVITKNLHEVVVFEQSDCDELLRLFKRCHDATEAHDAPGAAQANVPDPDDYAADIAAAKALHDALVKKKKALVKKVNP